MRGLAAEVDVVVENFKPGTVEAMDMTYDALLPANPRMIYASIMGFGRDGPYRTWSGFDQIAQGMSGLMSQCEKAGLTNHVEADLTKCNNICPLNPQQQIYGRQPSPANSNTFHRS